MQTEHLHEQLPGGGVMRDGPRIPFFSARSNHCAVVRNMKHKRERAHQPPKLALLWARYPLQWNETLPVTSTGNVAFEAGLQFVAVVREIRWILYPFGQCSEKARCRLGGSGGLREGPNRPDANLQAEFHQLPSTVLAHDRLRTTPAAHPRHT